MGNCARRNGRESHRGQGSGTWASRPGKGGVPPQVGGEWVGEGREGDQSGRKVKGRVGVGAAREGRGVCVKCKGMGWEEPVGTGSVERGKGKGDRWGCWVVGKGRSGGGETVPGMGAMVGSLGLGEQSDPSLGWGKVSHHQQG